LPVEDGAFYSLMNQLNTKKSLLTHSTFDRFLQIMNFQSSLVQTDSVRSTIEFSFNNLVNTARNQNYEHSPINLDQLADLYLGL
jgi:hypothetical protein